MKRKYKNNLGIIYSDTDSLVHEIITDNILMT